MYYKRNTFPIKPPLPQASSIEQIYTRTIFLCENNKKIQSISMTQRVALNLQFAALTAVYSSAFQPWSSRHAALNVSLPISTSG